MEDDATETTAPAQSRKSLASDLKSRIGAGVVLALVSGGLAWVGVLPFAALVLAIALLMAWEWSRVVREGRFDATLLVHALAAIMAVGLSAAGLAALGLAAVLAGAMIVLALEFGKSALLSSAGVFYTGLPAVSLIWLRGDEPWGAWAVLFVLAVVAATDTLAYFTGRALGGPKLMPRVSPNKTWSGFAGGLTAAAVAGALFQFAGAGPAWCLALTGVALGFIAQAGDLAESALKRAFGVKDVSQLIPGHGGFMDRADGIVTAAIAAGLLALYLDPSQPAAALLVHH